MKLFDQKQNQVRLGIEKQLIELLKQAAVSQDNKISIAQIKELLLSLPLYLDRVICLQHAFQAIEDTKITRSQKEKILSSLGDEYDAKILDIFGRDPAPPIAHYKGKISWAEYKRALAGKNITISEFILLTCGLILAREKFLKPVISQLMPIYDNYVIGNYSGVCVGQLIDLIKKRPDMFSSAEYAFIRKFAKNNLFEVNIYEAHERRFFESRLARLTLEDEKIQQSIVKVAKNLYGKTISSKKDLESFLTFTDFKDFIVEKYQRYFDTFPKNKIIIQGDIVKRKKKMFRNDMDPVASGNPGLMKSYSPAFVNEINQVRFYAQADVVRPVIAHHFPEFILFTSSLSGHAENFMNALMCYLQQNKHDPDLSRNVNDLILATIAVYNANGYHSFWEMAYIFNQEVTADILQQYRVKFRFLFPKEALVTAFADTQEYTKQICLRRALRTEMTVAIPDFSVETKDKDSLKLKPVKVPYIEGLDDEDEDSGSDEDFWNWDTDDKEKPKKSPVEKLDDFKEFKLEHKPPAEESLYQAMFKLQTEMEFRLGRWGGSTLFKNFLQYFAKVSPELEKEIKLGKEKLSTRAEKFGYKCHDVPGDGNCFFHAVKHQLGEEDKQMLREAIALDIFEHKSEYKEFFAEEGDIKAYAKNLMKPGVWADGYFAGKALARIKNVIVIIIPNDESMVPIVYKPAGATKRLVLGYEVGRHYQSLVATSGSKTTEDELQKIIDATPEIGGLQLEPSGTSSSSSSSSLTSFSYF